MECGVQSLQCAHVSCLTCDFCCCLATEACNVLCSLKPYNIKGKTVTTNVVAVLLSVMITQTISGLEGQCHLSGSCSTAWEVVALLGKL